MIKRLLIIVTVANLWELDTKENYSFISEYLLRYISSIIID